MTNTNVHFLSQTAEWTTPQTFFDALDAEFHFTLDPCATTQNAKCAKYYTQSDDGLTQDWSRDVVFMNPPYGRKIVKWVQKAYTEAQVGAIVVCLLPARTDTTWWHNWCIRGEVRFVRGRIKFGSSKWNAPFPSAVVIFRHEPKPPNQNTNAVKQKGR